MEASEIKLTITAEEVYRLVKMTEDLKEQLAKTRIALEAMQRDYDAYHDAQTEREANIRRQVEQSLEERVKVLERLEKRTKAYAEYQRVQGLCMNNIKAILLKRVTKADQGAIDAQLAQIDAAWKVFDAVQKECAGTEVKE